MIKEKLQDIFREVFDDSDLMLREDMKQYKNFFKRY